MKVARSIHGRRTLLPPVDEVELGGDVRLVQGASDIHADARGQISPLEIFIKTLLAS